MIYFPVLCSKGHQMKMGRIGPNPEISNAHIRRRIDSLTTLCAGFPVLCSKDHRPGWGAP